MHRYQTGVISGQITVARIGPKVGQHGPNWDKSKTFSDQISVYFWSPSQMWFEKVPDLNLGPIWPTFGTNLAIFGLILLLCWDVTCGTSGVRRLTNLSYLFLCYIRSVCFNYVRSILSECCGPPSFYASGWPLTLLVELTLRIIALWMSKNCKKKKTPLFF